MTRRPLSRFAYCLRLAVEAAALIALGVLIVGLADRLQPGAFP